MVALSLFPKFRVLAVMASAAASLFTTPALANASANADVIAPLRAAQAARHQSGDDEFRQLFASWQSLEKPARPARQNLVSSVLSGRIGTPAPGFARQTVSIPSLNPVDNFKLTSEFGMRNHPVIGGRREHKGIDLAAAVGTPVHATADGVVGRADWFSGYGLYVALEHGGDIETRYGHMSRLNVAAGQKVRKGDIIGYVGTTGRSTGPHLHYEVRIAGNPVNPLPYLQSGSIQRLPAGMPAVNLAMGVGEDD